MLPCLLRPVATIQACVAQLWRHNVDLEATLLKPMMVMPGADASSKASPEDVAQATLDVLQRCHTLSLSAACFKASGIGACLARVTSTAPMHLACCC